MMNGHDQNKSLDIFFQNLRSTLGGKFHELMDQFSIAKKHQGPNLSVSKLNALANRLNITSDSIFFRRIDYTTLKEQLEGACALPARYRGTEYSSRFSSIYMYKFCTKVLGAESAKFILQRYQLKDSHLESLSDTNNILLPSDICEYINEFYGMSKVEQMGESSLELLSQADTAKNIHQAVSGSEFFEYFFNQLLPSNVEKNYSWLIQKKGSGYIEVKGSPNPDVVSALGPQNVSNPALETLRKGFLKSVPKLYKECDVRVLKLKSISTGDLYDLYRVEYDQDHTSPVYLH